MPSSDPQPATISQAFWALLALVPDVGVWKITPQERPYRLERMRWLLAQLGNPQRAYRILHVAGTKGKGSTAALLANALGAAGRRTGLYTSPHVSDPAERISVFPRAMTDDSGTDERSVGACFRRIRDAIASTPRPPGGFPWTAFELVTAFALLYFQAARCRLAVIEAGIGGRWDATNIVEPTACVLTPVDLDHTDILGDTLAAIAAEKSGVIKPRIPVFSAPQPPEAALVFRQVSQAQQAPIRFLGDELLRLDSSMHAGGTDVTVRLRGMRAQSFRLALLGDFQARNAALAYLTLRHTFPALPCRAITAGLERTILPGRLELIPGAPAIMLDGAHTPLAVAEILAACQSLFPTPGILIFGAVAGKQIEAMARLLTPHFHHILISTPGNFKTSYPDQVAAVFQRRHPSVFLDLSPEQALRHARELARHTRPILVTGSFFLVAEIRKLLFPLET
jgi:dihydrofolate synthase / folylpolyglutamate synthase